MSGKVKWLALALSGAVLGQAVAAQPADPYVPKAQQHPARAPAASGEALRQQALSKLRLRFEEADGNHDGRLTREEAQQGGLGYVAKHFKDIDTAGRGDVGFEDVGRFLRQRAVAAGGR